MTTVTKNGKTTKITSVTGKGSASKAERQKSIRAKASKAAAESQARYLERLEERNAVTQADKERLEKAQAKAASDATNLEAIQKAENLKAAQAEQDKLTEKRLREAQIQKIQQELNVSRADAYYIAANPDDVRARALRAGVQTRERAKKQANGEGEITPVVAKQQIVEKRQENIFQDIELPQSIPKIVQRETQKQAQTRENLNLLKLPESAKQSRKDELEQYYDTGRQNLKAIQEKEAKRLQSITGKPKTLTGFAAESFGYGVEYGLETAELGQKAIELIATKQGRKTLTQIGKELIKPRKELAKDNINKIGEDFAKSAQVLAIAQKTPEGREVLEQSAKAAGVATGLVATTAATGAAKYYLENPTKVTGRLVFDVTTSKGLTKLNQLITKTDEILTEVLPAVRKGRVKPYIKTNPNTIKNVKLIQEEAQLVTAGESAILNKEAFSLLPKAPSKFEITYLEKSASKVPQTLKTTVKITDKGEIIKTQKVVKLPFDKNKAPKETGVVFRTIDKAEETIYTKIKDGKVISKDVVKKTITKEIATKEQLKKRLAEELNNFVVAKRQFTVQKAPEIEFLDNKILQTQTAKAKGAALLRIGDKEFIGGFKETAAVSKKTYAGSLSGQKAQAVVFDTKVGLTSKTDILKQESRLALTQKEFAKKQRVGLYSKGEKPFEDIAFIEVTEPKSSLLQESRLEADFLPLAEPQKKLKFTKFGKKGQVFTEQERKNIFDFEYEQPVGTISREDLRVSNIKRRFDIPETPRIKEKSIIDDFLKVSKKVSPKTKPLIFTRVGSKAKVDDILKISGKQNVKEKFNLDQNIAPRLSEYQATEPKQNISTIFAQDIAKIQKTSPKTDILQETITSPVQKPIQKPITEDLLKPKEEETKLKIILPDLFLEQRLKTKKQKNYAYEVYLKQQGKQVKLNKKDLTYSEAVALGAKTADEYPARTFTLKQKKNVLGRKDAGLNKNILVKFTQNKKNPLKFTEKTNFAIDSVNEVLGIPYKGQQAQKRRAKYGF